MSRKRTTAIVLISTLATTHLAIYVSTKVYKQKQEEVARLINTPEAESKQQR
jgi:hypothetical protein